MSRRLVLCFDGTWNTPDDRSPEGSKCETNVCQLYRSLAESDTQKKWYDEGVGNKWYNRFRGGIFGCGLSKNIKEGYNYLIDHYEDGDEIFIFGFSRGAYTARSLVGMIRNCGLLHKQYKREIDYAFELYRIKDEGPDSQTAINFRNRYSRDIPIKFLGIWDTVGALGIPVQSFRTFNQKVFEFHDTELSSIVEYGFHAVAIDEHREHYKATLWDPKKKPNQTIEQVWFSGAHCNVGGGYEDDRLSNITLRWMQEKAKACGLEFNTLAKVEEKSYIAGIMDSFSDFLKGLYSRLSQRYYRPLGQAAFGNELVDDTVKFKIKHDATYRPKNMGLHDLVKKQEQAPPEGT